ncbi:universal stress protein [Thermoplasma sp. Kam2015]|uniref:universal stress protein n=1 Tax=Thermoplasma sp. Kam2015 TaxID=2094122 RepID=UPI000D9B06EA|nr:universal stress protein [Thermoplasma sp. Kam2015]PYB68202.1 universal stress protein [Thermoplasma sp. Kam2015]
MKILVAYDGSDGSQKALSFSLNFNKSADKIIALYVSRDIISESGRLTYIPDTILERKDSEDEAILSRAKSILAASNVDFEVIKKNSDGVDVSKVIVDTAKELQCDMIVTGTRKLRGLSKYLLGSVSAGILAISNVPVIVVPP